MASLKELRNKAKSFNAIIEHDYKNRSESDKKQAQLALKYAHKIIDMLEKKGQKSFTSDLTVLRQLSGHDKTISKKEKLNPYLRKLLETETFKTSDDELIKDLYTKQDYEDVKAGKIKPINGVNDPKRWQETTLYIALSWLDMWNRDLNKEKPKAVKMKEPKMTNAKLTRMSRSI